MFRSPMKYSLGAAIASAIASATVTASPYGRLLESKGQNGGPVNAPGHYAMGNNTLSQKGRRKRARWVRK